MVSQEQQRINHRKYWVCENCLAILQECFAKGPQKLSKSAAYYRNFKCLTEPSCFFQPERVKAKDLK